MGECKGLSGPDQDELAYPVRHIVPETTSQKQGSELSNATMIPQMTMATDLTSSEDFFLTKLQ